MTPVTARSPKCVYDGTVPIKSYIVWPVPGKAAELESSLLQIPGCEVLPAENQELLLLVTDTPGDPEEEALTARLEALETLQCLSLVAGVGEQEAA